MSGPAGDCSDRSRFDESIELAMQQLPLTAEPTTTDREARTVDTNQFDMDAWDDLIANAGPSQCVAFDPEAPGGFRALTAVEERDLIDSVRASADRQGVTRRDEPERDLDRDDDRAVGS